MSNINDFHGRFSVLSAIRSPFKLVISNCLHHHHLKSTVQKGPMIEVIIPDLFFTMSYCGHIHYRTLSWFISKGECFPIQEIFLQL